MTTGDRERYPALPRMLPRDPRTCLQERMRKARAESRTVTGSLPLPCDEGWRHAQEVRTGGQGSRGAPGPGPDERLRVSDRGECRDRRVEHPLQLPLSLYRRRRPTPGLTPPRKRHQRHEPEHLVELVRLSLIHI